MWKKAPIFLCLLALCVKFVVVVGDADWVSVLIEQLSQQWRPYQVVLLVNSSSGRNEEDFMVKKLTNRLPIAIVNLSKIGVQWTNISRSTTIFIVVQVLIGNEDVVGYLDSIVNLSPFNIRPRCLMIFFNKNFQARSFYENLLLHAWRKKFLDFSIIHADPDEAISVLRYNPFKATYTSKPYSPMVNLFPDKVADMHGYELRLPYIDSAPYIRRISEAMYDGTDYQIVKFVAEILNFKPVLLDYASGYSALERAVRDLETGELNLLSFTLFASHPLTLNNSRVQRGAVFTFDYFCALVSPYSDLMIDLPFEILVSFLLGIFSVLSIVLVIDRVGILKQRVDPFAVTQILLGEPGVKHPVRNGDRIIFLCVVIVSMTYFDDIYAKLMESKLSDEPRPLATFEDVAKSKLTPHISEGNYNWIFNDSEVALQNMKPRTKTSETKTCIRYIFEGQRVICFVFKSKGKMYVKKHIQDGRLKIKIADIKFLFNGKNFVFENSSPLVEKFDQIIRKMVEAGIIQMWNRRETQNKVKPVKEKGYWTKKNNYLLSVQLTIILSIGCAFSTLVFSLELLYHYLKRK